MDDFILCMFEFKWRGSEIKASGNKICILEYKIGYKIYVFGLYVLN